MRFFGEIVKLRVNYGKLLWNRELFQNWGSFVLQKTRKVGNLQVAMLQFPRRDQRHLRLPHVAADWQPCDLPMTNFSCLLQDKGAPIFQIKQPLFWKKRQICSSLSVIDTSSNYFFHVEEPRVRQSDFWCPVIFVRIWRKTGLLEVGIDVEFADFLRNIGRFGEQKFWKIHTKSDGLSTHFRTI